MLLLLIIICSTLLTNCFGNLCQSSSVYSITLDQFAKAVQWSGRNRSMSALKKHYQVLMEYAHEGDITTRKEFAMFLAQVIYETGGLRSLNENCNYEKQCQNKTNWQTICGRQNSDYLSCTVDSNGRKYCGPCNPCACTKPYTGRGYLKLTHDFNYLASSIEIYNRPNFLSRYPDLVSMDLQIAARTSYWLWRKKVHHKVCGDDFGESSRAINMGDRKTKAIRYEIYKHVLTSFGINDPPCGGKFTFGLNGPYCSSERYILVLDISGSMVESDKINHLKTAASVFVENLSRGSEVGIVTFSSQAWIESPLTQILETEQSSDRNSPEKVKLKNDILALQVVDSTCISCGIRKALELVNGKPDCGNKRTEIILLTDGNHNSYNNDDWVAVTLPKIKEANVKVHTIAIGSEMDNNLAAMAMATGGIAWGMRSASNSLTGIFESIMAVSECESHVKPKSVKSAVVSTSEGPTFVPIDIDIGLAYQRPVSITIDYSGQLTQKLSVKIIRPQENSEKDDYKKSWLKRSKRDVSTYNEHEADEEPIWSPDYNTPIDDVLVARNNSTTSPVCEDNPIFQRITCTFVPQVAGRWMLALQTSSSNLDSLGNSTSYLLNLNCSYEITLFAETNETFPIMLNGQLGFSELDDVQTSQNITATFTANGKPILNAIIEAMVQSLADGSTWIVPLWDDGLYPDETACDGTYAGSFSEATVLGDYSVMIAARGLESKEPQRYNLTTIFNETTPSETWSQTSAGFETIKYLFRTKNLGSFKVTALSECNLDVSTGNFNRSQQLFICNMPPPKANPQTNSADVFTAVVIMSSLLAACYLLLVIICSYLLIRNKTSGPIVDRSAEALLAREASVFIS